MRLASRAPAIAQPSPMPAAAPGATFGLFCAGMELAVLMVELIENVVKLVEFIEIVGELVGLDEEGTHSTLKACRRELIDPKIAEHRGRIVKTTGDGALVEFASAVDAVRCAMEIQRAMAETLKASALVAVVGPTLGTPTSFWKNSRSTPRWKPMRRGIGALVVTK